MVDCQLTVAILYYCSFVTCTEKLIETISTYTSHRWQIFDAAFVYTIHLLKICYFSLQKNSLLRGIWNKCSKNEHSLLLWNRKKIRQSFYTSSGIFKSANIYFAFTFASWNKLYTCFSLNFIERNVLVEICSPLVNFMHFVM